MREPEWEYVMRSATYRSRESRKAVSKSPRAQSPPKDPDDTYICMCTMCGSRGQEVKEKNRAAHDRKAQKKTRFLRR